MGTRADFYVGKGRTAKWLGSIGFDGYPDGIDAQLLNCTSVSAYKHAVKDFLNREDGTLPEQGWPWPWEDSTTTDYAYSFSDGKVIAWCFGKGPFDPTKEQPENEGNKCEFPNMKKRQKVTIGKRSGLIVLSVKDK